MKRIAVFIKRSWLNLLLLLVVLWGVNSTMRNTFFRVDLTQDKRYSLAEVTKSFLKNLDEPVTIRVYLTDDINPGFNRLHRATKDLLTEFSVYAGDKLMYEFPEPGKVSGEAEYKRYQEEIKTLGLRPVNVVDEGPRGEKIQVPVFPWAVIEAGDRKYAVRLLVNIAGKGGEENLNRSVETLEYNITDGLRIITGEEVRRIAFLEGHEELPDEEVYDVTGALSHYFQVDRGVLGSDPEVLNGYELLIVAQPKKPFSEKDKYIIDQYVMNGGKILWLLEGVGISTDSLRKGPETIGIYNDLNLDDLLFTYGVRVNPTLVQDIQCALYPVNFAAQGQKPNFQPVPWYYSPLLFEYKDHPVTRGLSPVKAEFCSNLDTVGDPSLKKQPLLVTGGQSNVMQAPAPVNLEMTALNLEAEDFREGAQMIACLVEGRFKSVFRNRFVPDGVNADNSDIIKQSPQNAMIVIGDGDIIRNEVEGSGENKRVYPLGFDRFTSQNLFSNRNFILNCVNYLTDDAGWMELRSKQIKLRLLSKVEANENRFKWQFINIGFPLLFLLIGGASFILIRKRRYSG